MGRGPGDSPPCAHPGAYHLRPHHRQTAPIYNRQGAAGDPRLKGGGATARSTERATATRPHALLGDQKPSPREADGNPESTARDPRGDTASRSPSRAPPYLAGFVELLFEPGHRHRGSAPPGLGAPSGHAAATLSGAGTPGGPRAPHGHGHRHGAVTLAHARARR